MNKALFLDRDGVINEDSGYCYRPQDCVFVDGIFDLVLKAQRHDFLVFVVTNQSGIARGYYSESQFLEFTSWIEAQFRLQGARIAQTYYCPHHPDFPEKMLSMNSCRCRKPEPGMILKAVADHEINAEHSIMVGDNVSDMEAATRAGIGRRVLFNCSSSSIHEDFRASAMSEVESFLFGDSVHRYRPVEN